MYQRFRSTKNHYANKVDNIHLNRVVVNCNNASVKYGHESVYIRIISFFL